MEKYSSAEMITPIISRKFIKFPTPKYLRIKKAVRPTATRNPRLVFVKIVAAVKRVDKKASKKKDGIAPGVNGSAK